MVKKTSNDVLRNNLKLLRKENHYTQSKLSEVLGVEEKHYSSLENGRYNFTLKNVDILADFYGKEYWELFSEDLFKNK